MVNTVQSAVHNFFHQVMESLQVKNIYQILCEFKKYALEKNLSRRYCFYNYESKLSITGQTWLFPEEKKVKGHVEFEL